MRRIYKTESDKLIVVENSGSNRITIRNAEEYSLDGLNKTTTRNIKASPETGRRFLTKNRRVQSK